MVEKFGIEEVAKLRYFFVRYKGQWNKIKGWYVYEDWILERTYREVCEEFDRIHGLNPSNSLYRVYERGGEEFLEVGYDRKQGKMLVASPIVSQVKSFLDLLPPLPIDRKIEAYILENTPVKFKTLKKVFPQSLLLDALFSLAKKGKIYVMDNYFIHTKAIPKPISPVERHVIKEKLSLLDELSEMEGELGQKVKKAKEDGIKLMLLQGGVDEMV